MYISFYIRNYIFYLSNHYFKFPFISFLVIILCQKIPIFTYFCYLFLQYDKFMGIKNRDYLKSLLSLSHMTTILSRFVPLPMLSVSLPVPERTFRLKGLYIH